MHIDAIEKMGGALGDKSRLKILQEVARRGSLSCREAEELTSLAQPTISHHIKTLVESGLLVCVKEGRSIRLSINKEKIEAIRGFLLGLS